MSVNAAGAGVGNGDQIKLWQHANNVSINGAQVGIGGGTGGNATSDLYINNAPSISVIGNNFGSSTNVIEAGDTASNVFGNSFRLGAVLTRNAASQWAMNTNSTADGLQLRGIGTPTLGAIVSSSSTAVTYGEQGISVAGSTAATNGSTQVSSIGNGNVQAVTGGFVRFAAGNVQNGGVLYEVPLVDANYAFQNFNTTPTYTFGNGVTSIINNAGASTGVAITVTMPAAGNVTDGMQVRVMCGFGMTSVTWAANTSQTMVAGGSVACPAGTSAQFMYRATGTTWYKTS
jgi:hypothetical protein